MKILVACERSGRVRDAFIRGGHEAVSCDLLPSLMPGPHIQGDVRPLLCQPWDMVIAFPPCTYLCHSGYHYTQSQPGRYERTLEAAAFFRDCLAANAPRVAVENPTMAKEARRLAGAGDPSFAVQLYQFGASYSKRTCFWAKGLPPLLPTQIGANGRDDSYQVWTLKLPPPLRAMVRGFTYPGLAEAIAQQWGSLEV